MDARRRAEELLGRPLPPEDTPEYVQVLAELARRDPALARAVAAKAPHSPPKEVQAAAARAEAALRSEARRAGIRQSLQRLRDSFFFRQVSQAGRFLRVPRKPVYLLLGVAVAAAGLWFALSLTSAPKPASPGVAQGLLTEAQAASLTQEELSQRAEALMGQPLPSGEAEREAYLSQLESRDPVLARELRRRQEAQAPEDASSSQAPSSGDQAPQASPSGPGQATASPPSPSGVGSSEAPPSEPPPPAEVPPVPPPPTAPPEDSPEEDPYPFTLSERVLPPGVSPSLSLERGSQSPQGQSQQGQSQQGQSQPRGLVLVERNASLPEHFRAQVQVSRPPLLLSRSPEAGQPSPAKPFSLAERPKPSPLTLVPEAPSDPSASPAPGRTPSRGFTVLAQAPVPTPSSSPPSAAPVPPASPSPSSPSSSSLSSPFLPPSPPSQGEVSSPQVQTPPLSQPPQPPLPPQPSQPSQPSQAPQAPQASSLPYQPGRLYTARLQVELVVPEGASVPAVLEGVDGSLWVGSARLSPLGRVQVDLDTVYLRGASYPVRAMAYDEDRQLGLQASLREEAPSLAQDLLRASAAAFGRYTEYLAKQTSVVQLPGGGVAQTQQAPPLEYVLLGEVGKLFSLPADRRSLVRLGLVPAGKVVQVMVLGQR